MNKFKFYFAITILFTLLVGCKQVHVPKNPSPASKNELEFYKEWKKWNAQKIKSYSFTVSRTCFCPPEEKIHIVVKNSKIVSSKFVPSHKPLPIERQKRVMSIDDYFRKIDNAFKNRYAHIGLKFDKRYHYPEEMFFDTSKEIADDEIDYKISDFKVLSTKTDNVFCPQIYEPVCAKVQVQCITTPCPSFKKTFSNSCFMKKNKLATFLHKGRCK